MPTAELWSQELGRLGLPVPHDGRSQVDNNATRIDDGVDLSFDLASTFEGAREAPHPEILSILHVHALAINLRRVCHAHL